MVVVVAAYGVCCRVLLLHSAEAPSFFFRSSSFPKLTRGGCCMLLLLGAETPISVSSFPLVGLLLLSFSFPRICLSFWSLFLRQLSTLTLVLFLSFSFPFLPLLFSFLFSSLFSLENKLSPSSLPFLFCIRAVFIGAGGAGLTLPRPIICMWCEAAAPPCHGTGWDIQYGCRLQDTALWFLIMRRCGWRLILGFDRGERRKKKQETKKKTYLPLVHVQGKKKKKQCRLKTTLFCFSPFSFWRMHKTALFFPKTRRFI